MAPGAATPPGRYGKSHRVSAREDSLLTLTCLLRPPHKTACPKANRVVGTWGGDCNPRAASGGSKGLCGLAGSESPARTACVELMASRAERSVVPGPPVSHEKML